MTREDLKKLREALPKGGREKLAEMHNVSVGHINQIMTGNRENEIILLSAVEIVNEHRNKMKEATKYIQTEL